MKTVVELADAVRCGKLHAVDIVAEAFARIRGRDGKINAFAHLDEAAATHAANAVDARIANGEDPGPLAGVPFGVKDNEFVAGMPTRRGSLLCKDAGPEPETPFISPDCGVPAAFPSARSRCPSSGLMA